MRIHHIQCLYNKIIDKALSDEGFDAMENGLNENDGKLEKINMISGDAVFLQCDKGKQVMSNSEQESRNLVPLLHAPGVRSTTGSGSSKRFKLMREKT